MTEDQALMMLRTATYFDDLEERIDAVVAEIEKPGGETATMHAELVELVDRFGNHSKALSDSVERVNNHPVWARLEALAHPTTH